MRQIDREFLKLSNLLNHILGVATHLASKFWQDLKIGKALLFSGKKSLQYVG